MCILFCPSAPSSVCTLSIESIACPANVERKSTAHTQTILRTWGAFSRPPMPIYAVGIAQAPSVNTPTSSSFTRGCWIVIG